MKKSEVRSKRQDNYKDLPRFNSLVDEVRSKNRRQKNTERVGGYEQKYKNT